MCLCVYLVGGGGKVRKSIYLTGVSHPVQEQVYAFENIDTLKSSAYGDTKLLNE